MKPFSKKHKLSIPTAANNQMGSRLIVKSGVLFVILMAMGFDHDTSYRTAAQPVKWGHGGVKRKIKDVYELLVNSGELDDIIDRTEQIYKV